MLELAILGLLKEQDLHGYELKKRLTEALGPWSSVSFGSLYPALGRLEAAGAVAVQIEDQVPAEASIPMTGSLGGELAAFRARRGTGSRQARATAKPSRRAKKVYRITERGEQLFEELLAASDQSGDDDRAFSLRLAFARHLAAEARLGLLLRRRAHLVERLEKTRASVRASRERLDRYTSSLVEHRTQLTEQDISWLDQLIAAERKTTT